LPAPQLPRARLTRRGAAPQTWCVIPILDISGLRVDRGPARILRGIDWRVRPGEHWAILGANGSGKTSLLRALAGYLTPTAGTLAVLGEEYGRSDWPELRRRIGIVSNALTGSIPPDETALETVISGRFAQLDLWARVRPADRLAARRLLRTVGLGRLAERPWVHLSQGERQRVLIARALAARPELLILDEPCAGLDPVAREKFLAFVAGLARRRARGPALVLVTHHVEEIIPAFTRVLLLRRGRVLAAGPRRQVLTSANLSAVFGARLTLSRTGGHTRLVSRRRTW
jgi:iron complex transport system ATP-binding protein